MLTLFAIPKTWQGHISIIQRNALQSWTLLHPNCEIILFGNEKGTAEMAEQLKVRHHPKIAHNKYGTPLINDIFEKAQNLASYDTLCYLNSDIILMKDFVKAVKRVTQLKHRFLMVGRRWNIEQKDGINFDDPDWDTLLKREIIKNGQLFSNDGIDYFVFKRGAYFNIPAFAVGRPAWDNWILYYTRFQNIPLIDATSEVTAVHQNHGNHRPDKWEGPEHQHNLELAGGYGHVFSLQDATHILTHKSLKLALSCKHLNRRRQTIPLLYPKTRPLVNIVRKIKRMICNERDS